jgi:hypothetical protein
MLTIEKYIYVLDKLYRCFIPYCLNRMLWKENGSRESINTAISLIVILVCSCQGGIK